MATKKPAATSSGGITLGLSQTITLKDLIVIISVAVSMALAWGVFGTRITVLEKEMIATKDTIAQQSEAIRSLDRQLHKLEAREQDDQQFIDELYRASRKSLPRRSAD